MKESPESLVTVGKKKMGRPKMGDKKRVKLTLTLSPEIVEAAHGLSGSLSQRVERLLVGEIEREAGK